MNNAIYIVETSKENAPSSMLGLCALEDVPKDSVLVVSSPDAETIFNLTVEVSNLVSKRTSDCKLAFATSVADVVTYLSAACDVERLGQEPSRFSYEIVKSVELPAPHVMPEFDRKRIDAYYRRAPKVVSAIHDAIAEAAKQGDQLEAIFFGGKFPEMNGKPKIIYKVECRDGENIVVGGEMTFAPEAIGTILMITEREINLYGADGIRVADFPLLGPGDIQKEQQVVSDAMVAFFARCYEKRM